MRVRSFLGGSVVKDPPANAGDMDLTPDLERSHMEQSNEVCAPQPLSLCSRAQKPQLPKPILCNKRSHHDEKPVYHN